jgi:glucose-6-phosphate isomerase
MRLLLLLADKRGVAKRGDAMFAGEVINTTERRAVLHVARHPYRGRWRGCDA